MGKTAELYGLVLCGGKSTRMGSDKALLRYHDLPQAEFVGQLLAACGCSPLLSLRKAQKANLSGRFPVIEDALDIPGPMNGMLSAHQAFPNHAFLVVAADMPLLKQETLETLIHHRDASALATVFLSGDQEFPEPLCAIWEPAALALLMSSKGSDWGYSPVKFLSHHAVNALKLPQGDALINVNTPEGFEQVKSLLKKDRGEELTDLNELK